MKEFREIARKAADVIIKKIITEGYYINVKENLSLNNERFSNSIIIIDSELSSAAKKLLVFIDCKSYNDKERTWSTILFPYLLLFKGMALTGEEPEAAYQNQFISYIKERLMELQQ